MVILQDDLSALRICDADVNVNDDCVNGTSSLLIENYRNGAITDDLPGHHEVAGFVGGDAKSSPTDQFLSHRFRHSLFDPVGCAAVLERRNSHRPAFASSEVLVGQSVSTSGEGKECKENGEKSPAEFPVHGRRIIADRG